MLSERKRERWIRLQRSAEVRRWLRWPSVLRWRPAREIPADVAYRTEHDVDGYVTTQGDWWVGLPSEFPAEGAPWVGP